MREVAHWVALWGLGMLAILLWWHGRGRYLAGYTRAVEDLRAVQPALDGARGGYRADELLVQCSWCTRLQMAEHVWASLGRPRLVQAVTHGACSRCVTERLQALREKGRVPHE